MKLKFLCIAAMAMMLGACGNSDGKASKDAETEQHEHAEGDGHEHGEGDGHEHGEGDGHEHEAEGAGAHNGEIEVPAAVAARFGIENATIQPGQYSESVKAAGVFMSDNSSMATVSAPLSGTVSYPKSVTVGAKVGRGAALGSVKPGAVEGANPNAAARAAMQAAKREVDRLKPLYDDKLVTASEYNAALAAYEQARAAFAPGAGGALRAPISGVITSVDVAQGQFAQAGQPLITISAGGNLTLRVDVPRRQFALARTASDANVVMPDGRTVRLSDLGARRISGGEQGSASASGFVPVYFSVPNANGSIPPGTTAEVYLISTTSTGSGISVPRTALCEIQGDYYIYKKVADEDAYIRIPVTIGGTDGAYTRILSGLQPGDVIAVSGVTTIRLTETSGKAPEGHSH